MSDQIRRLLKAHSVPNDEKMFRKLHQIDRMRRFYQDKAEIAPEKQAILFTSFVSSLTYAAAAIRAYRQLTEDLSQLIEEKETNED